jgi:hypothetical protein
MPEQTMAYLTLPLSTLLALTGIGCALVGIIGEQWKALGAGFVLIIGAGVFATLYTGTRLSSGNQARSPDNGPRGGTNTKQIADQTELR